MRKKKDIYFHVLGCLLFLALPVFLSPDFSFSFRFVRVPFFQRDFACYALLIVFFYLNYFIFIPRFYFRRSFVIFCLFMLLSYVVIVLLPELLINPGSPSHQHFEGHPGRFCGGPSFENHWLHEFGQHFFQFILVLIFSLMLRISSRWKQSEKERLGAELSYLKAQINPHFLFNTLNSIYSLAIEKSDDTPAAVVKLSEMMRYVTTEANQDFVSLEKELRYISSYIELQKIRFEDTIRFSFDITGDPAGKRIAPLILIPFVENAFKHGVNPEEDSEIQVSISIHEDNLHMVVFNKKVNVRLQNEERTEQGIENTRNRLQMLYPAKFLLIINNEKSGFSVNLTINLK
jgi:hypothetical protein